jgi:hypothetical protein
VRDCGDGRRDAIGPYPVLACDDWRALDDDLRACTDVVSVVAVADPLGDVDGAGLRRAFPDLARPWKLHHLVHLDRPVDDHADRDHLRKARRARRSVAVDRTTDVDSWAALYGELRARPGFGVAADFADSSWPGLFALPGCRAYAASTQDGAIVAMALWLLDGGRAWYHLGASSAAGYAIGASFAVFEHALADLRADGIAVADLGGVAGSIDDPTDGLARFKRGWANDRRHAWLCGRILDADAYDELAAGSPPAGTWFPAYRAPQPAMAVAS